MPLGGPQPREELLGEREQAVGLQLGLTDGARGFVLLVDRLANPGDAAPQQLIGNGPLRVGQLRQDRVAMSAPRTKANHCRCRGGCRTIAPRRTRGTLGTRAAMLGSRWTVATRRAVAARCATSGAVAAWTVGATGTCRAITAGPPVAVGAVSARTAAIAVAVSTPALFDERARHELFVALRADDFDALRFLARTRRGEHRHDDDALEIALGVHSKGVADLRARRQHCAFDVAFGLFGSGGTPGPTSVGARAGELDVDPAGHRQPKLLRMPAKRRA